MANEQLIDRLVTDLKPVRRRSVTADFLILLLICLIELGLFIGLGGMRPDMPDAVGRSSFWWKLGSLGTIALLSASVAVLSLDPGRSPRRGLRGLASIVAISLAAGWAIDASQTGLPALAARLHWQDGFECVWKMAVLSVPAVLGFGFLMRRGASTDSDATALAAGLSAAAWGAFVFVFVCPYDDPLYIAVWYAIGCGIVTAFARLVLPALTRW